MSTYRGHNDLFGYEEYDYEDVDSDGEINPIFEGITPPWQNSDGQKSVKESKPNQKLTSGSMCIGVNLPENHRSPSIFFSKAFGISPLYKFRLEMSVEACSDSHQKSTKKSSKNDSYYERDIENTNNELCDRYQFRVKCRLIYLGMKPLRCIAEFEAKTANEKAEMVPSFDIKIGIEKDKRFKKIMQKDNPEFELFSIVEEIIAVDKRKHESITIGLILDIARDKNLTWNPPDLQVIL